MGGGRYTVTVRRGPAVERERFESLSDALAFVEGRGRDIEGSTDLGAVRIPLARSFEAPQRVAARIEVSSRRRKRGGVDIRGDGSSEAFTGALIRRLVEQRAGESAYDALRRSLEEDA